MCDSDPDYEDESKKDDESLQEAYEKMYTQWLKVYGTNQVLNSRIQKLHDLKTKAERKVVQFEMLLAEKDEKLKFVATKLERTEKTLRLLISGTSKLYHMITTIVKLYLLNLVCLLILLVCHIISLL